MWFCNDSAASLSKPKTTSIFGQYKRGDSDPAVHTKLAAELLLNYFQTFRHIYVCVYIYAVRIHQFHSFLIMWPVADPGFSRGLRHFL